MSRSPSSDALSSVTAHRREAAKPSQCQLTDMDPIWVFVGCKQKNKQRNVATPGWTLTIIWKHGMVNIFDICIPSFYLHHRDMTANHRRK